MKTLILALALFAPTALFAQAPSLVSTSDESATLVSEGEIDTPKEPNQRGFAAIEAKHKPWASGLFTGVTAALSIKLGIGIPRILYALDAIDPLRDAQGKFGRGIQIGVPIISSFFMITPIVLSGLVAEAGWPAALLAATLGPAIGLALGYSLHLTLIAGTDDQVPLALSEVFRSTAMLTAGVVAGGIAFAGTRARLKENIE